MFCFVFLRSGAVFLYAQIISSMWDNAFCTYYLVNGVFKWFLPHTEITLQVVPNVSVCTLCTQEKKNYSNNEKNSTEAKAPKKKHFSCIQWKLNCVHLCIQFIYAVEFVRIFKTWSQTKISLHQKWRHCKAAAAALHFVFFFISPTWLWSVSVIVNRISTLILVVKRILILDNYWLNRQITLYLTFRMDAIHWVDAKLTWKTVHSYRRYKKTTTSTECFSARANYQLDIFAN